MIDDVTYTPLYGGTSDLTLKGYNIYRDGELIAAVWLSRHLSTKLLLTATTLTACR